jgi:hypothetical protein
MASAVPPHPTPLPDGPDGEREPAGAFERVGDFEPTRASERAGRMCPLDHSYAPAQLKA